MLLLLSMTSSKAINESQLERDALSFTDFIFGGPILIIHTVSVLPLIEITCNSVNYLAKMARGDNFEFCDELLRNSRLFTKYNALALWHNDKKYLGKFENKRSCL